MRDGRIAPGAREAWQEGNAHAVIVLADRAACPKERPVWPECLGQANNARPRTGQALQYVTRDQFEFK